MSANPSWWDVARATRGLIQAIVKNSGAKYIVPTNIDMVIGIASKYFDN